MEDAMANLPKRCMCCEALLRNDAYGDRCEDCWASGQPNLVSYSNSERGIGWTPPKQRSALAAEVRGV